MDITSGKGRGRAVKMADRAAPEPSSSLVVENLSAWYGQAQALFDVRLRVPTGTIVGLFGHNGAGKSTLLRSIAGLHTSCRGRIVVGSQDLLRIRRERVLAAGVYLVREGSRVFDLMTVDEHLALAAARASKLSRRKATPESAYDAIPLLDGLRRRQAGLLSGGQRQALGLGMSVVLSPQILLLDEPSTGLAPTVVEQIYSIIVDLSERGTTLLIAEQNPQWLVEICHDSYIMDVGRLTPGTPRGAENEERHH